MESNYYFGQNENEVFAIKWEDPPIPEFAGVQGAAEHPLVVNASGMTPSAEIHFYASNSNSFPNESKDGWWKNLIPTWKFVDEDGTPVYSAMVSGTETETEGVYEYKKSVWYVDDLPTKQGQDIYLWCIMEVSANKKTDEKGNPSYANTTIFDIVKTKVGGFSPDQILYTTDGRTPLNSKYHWTDDIIPFVGVMHSTQYDALEGKLDNGPGIIYNFPNKENELVPFECTTRLSKSVTAEEIAEATENGRKVLDNEGMPIMTSALTFFYNMAPIVSYEGEKSKTVSAYLQASAYEDIDKNPFASATFIEDSYTEYDAPCFNLYDNNNKNHFYTGGYFIGNITMPEKAISAGYEFTGSAKNDFADKTYVPPNGAWVVGDGNAYKVLPSEKAEKSVVESLQSDIKKWSIARSNGDSSLPSDINISTEISIKTIELGDDSVSAMSVDQNYNCWMVGTETANLYKCGAHGDLLLSSNLNDEYEKAFGESAAFHPTKIQTTNTTPNCTYIVCENDGMILCGDSEGHIIGRKSTDMMNPISIKMGASKNIWVAYESTSGEESKINLYDNGEIEGSDYEYKYQEGTKIMSMSIYDGMAYVLLSFGSEYWVDELSKAESGLSARTIITKDELESAKGMLVSDVGCIWVYDEEGNITAKYINDIEGYVFDAFKESESVNGLASDADGFIWAVTDNGVARVNGVDLVKYAKGIIDVPPETEYMEIPDATNLVAEGNWTGAIFGNSLSTYSYGKSGVVRLVNYKNFHFRKYNESWDIVPNMQSNILVGKFEDSSRSFWEEYANSMVGGVDNNSYPIGRRLFERIANLVPNLHDVEDCTIDGLNSMALAQDVPVDTYDIHYPEAIQRVVDMFSCRHERIWGERCPCTSNYTETQRNLRNKTYFCYECGHWHKTNLGDRFGINDRDLEENKTPYIVRNPMETRSRFLRINPSEDSVNDASLILEKILYGTYKECDSDVFFKISDAFAESILELPSRKAQILAIHTQFYVEGMWFNYCFWNFIDTKCGVQNIGLVHWDDEYTTFPEALSGIEDFYSEPSCVDGNPVGYASLVFDHIIHNGLMFSKDGYK